MSAELQHAFLKKHDKNGVGGQDPPDDEAEEELVEEIDYAPPTWKYPDDLCREHGYLRYRIMKCKKPWKNGKTKFKFYFYRDSDTIANCSYNGMQCENKRGKKFWSVLA